MHSETEIKKAIRTLLDKYGQLNISEIKQKLEEVIIYDEDDIKQSKTRNEIKIIQRIGNVTCHQDKDEKIKIYEEGFILDKTSKPAIFTAISGIGKQKQAISESSIQDRKNKANKFIGKKVNWSKKREKDEELGNMGEEFIYEYEKSRVSKFDPSSIGRVLHLSRLQGDGLGYDISSVNNDGSIRRIEVKTTSGGLNTPFYMSKNEKLFFQTYKNDGAFIYRVYDFDKMTRRGKVFIITAKSLLHDYNFDPITFAVTKKCNK